MEDLSVPAESSTFALSNFNFQNMRKINLDFLMNGAFSPLKDQVLIHAASELKGLPYKPIMYGIHSSDIVGRAHKLSPASNFINSNDIAACSVYVRSVISSLIDGGEISKSELENKISVLMETVYSDSLYINGMGPFF